MKSITSASLPRPQTAASLRLRWLVNEQQRAEIGARLRDLRDNSPETNRSIGDYVGVAERTVAEWSAGRQGITYDHARKVAKLFDVDLDWFWRGKEKGPTPDVLGDLSDPLAEIVRRLKNLEEKAIEIQAALAELEVEKARGAVRAPKRRRPASG